MTAKRSGTTSSGFTDGAVLLGDIGGTNARFALLSHGEIGPISHIVVADYPDVCAAISDFLSRQTPGRGITSAVLGLAGPLEGDRCAITNSHWIVEGRDLRAKFAIRTTHFVNDFEAVAWSLPDLDTADLYAVGPGRPVPSAPMIVLGPGTGLGVAALLTHAGKKIVIATEGGHATLAGSSRREDAIIDHLRHRFGHVSAERALSGVGLENLYQAIIAVDGLNARPRRAAEITQAALDGTCPASRAALDMFCAMLGTVAGSLAMIFRAQGGIFIAGGIIPRVVDYFAASEFRARFEAMGRFRHYVEVIPTNVILHPDVAFLGLKSLAEFNVAAIR